MGKPGPKPAPPDVHKLRNDRHADRQVVELFSDVLSRPDPENLPAPYGMTDAAALVWDDKVERYRQRGQKIQGFETMLRVYCEAEVSLLEAFKNKCATASMLNAFRGYAVEFYDTPASMRVKASTVNGAKGNQFGANANRPQVA